MSSPGGGGNNTYMSNNNSSSSTNQPAVVTITEEVALQRLDEAATQLQKEGRYLEALECMERGLVLRQRMFGVQSDEVWAACKSAGELCNLLSMSYLQKQDYGMVSELLKKAEIFTEKDPAGRAVTYNNYACFTRQQGRLHAALQFLQKALTIEEKLPHVDNPADTHLNLCAVLSQMNRHEEALNHAQSALRLLQDELFDGPGGAASAASKPDRIAVLAIAYHNLGVEHEFLKQFTASLQAYTKGVEIASVYLGAAHGITATLRASQLSAAKAIEKAKKEKDAREKQKAELAARHAVTSSNTGKKK